ncbi:hypothetical protein CEG14_19560 [Bordetella genomosp. 1]|uniref:Uncharacterized protein n=1 Tax=Bordetella genomosp. 1 TaxID=1395607 RepID=A0A261S7T3_9BORD|nr:hypothetical protein [Bordetella genomosp. 1]MDQ8033929.1 hypothetical protein [Bordetella sp.]OZI33057.1 hypothetical protein CEG14_19560 [Bordetella genomosp. 1]OZI57160.1 hypothetical protein CAL27_23220 [Bordetella genomosp. 1]
MTLCQPAIVVSEAHACAIAYVWARRNEIAPQKVERLAQEWFAGRGNANQRTWTSLIEFLRSRLPHAAYANL